MPLLTLMFTRPFALVRRALLPGGPLLSRDACFAAHCLEQQVPRPLLTRFNSAWNSMPQDKHVRFVRVGIYCRSNSATGPKVIAGLTPARDYSPK